GQCPKQRHKAHKARAKTSRLVACAGHGGGRSSLSKYVREVETALPLDVKRVPQASSGAGTLIINVGRVLFTDLAVKT
ncbi:MAG: hypothetical protein ACRDHZ_08720, partial [Ktedonobacteraceae bacterium]